MPFSVLISVYKKEKPEYLQRALESLEEQTLLADEIVIVKDGELTNELEEVLSAFTKKLPLKVIALKENVMLGRALAVGLLECCHERVARMDSDDIAIKHRFALQMAFMDANPNISAVGGYISEFMHEGEIIRTKSMPLMPKELRQYAKFRNPLNHMTVMFQKSKVLEAGNYTHFPLLEDYHLWSRMLAKGFALANMNTVLVLARIGADFSNKRGGWAYFKKYRTLRALQKKWGLTNVWEYGLAIWMSALMTLQPKVLRDKVYAWLRK